MTLNALYDRLWGALELGVAREASAHSADPQTHDFRLGVLATCCEHGADARTVVLRSVSRTPAQVLIYSDRRAPKIEQVERDPRATLVVYAGLMQLRLRGLIGIHRDDALADACWNACPLSSRRAYLAAHAPGSVLDRAGSGLPPGLDQRAPTLAESEQGRARFAVLRLAIEEIDCLLLEASGHRRAAFCLDGLAVSGEWRIP